MFTVLVALVAAGALGPIQPDSLILGFPAHARIADDSAHQQLVITLGPVVLPAHTEHHMVEQLGVQSVALPRGGWLQGYDVDIVDSGGRLLPRALIHHVELIELDRRALLDGQVQRMASVGKETGDVRLPGFIGYPVRRGEALGINPMLDNPTDTSYPAAYVRLRIPYTPENAEDRPVDVYSIGTDVTGAVGRSSDFDIPAGRSSLSHEFAVPISGALLAIGGHLHDLGLRLVLVNLATGDTVYDARAARDTTGRVLGMPVRQLWRTGGYQIAAGQRFRLTAFYDNPTGHTVAAGAMGTFGGAFKPDDVQAWPRLDPKDPETQRDLTYLHSLGGAMGGMPGMNMQ
ncbi:MAG TPA: hypothetical protein VMF70_12260 [Gemmatimonadales bacterium]|nr:hypothetical protein [Gemmatimonadales bacterium]